eukprot:gene2608-3428_t
MTRYLLDTNVLLHLVNKSQPRAGHLGTQLARRMQVEISLRKFGNSTGVAFPPSVLKDLGWKAGQAMTMGTTADGKITLEPKRRYNLAELIAQCDAKAPPPADLALWDAAQPVGQ